MTNSTRFDITTEPEGASIYYTVCNVYGNGGCLSVGTRPLPLDDAVRQAAERVGTDDLAAVHNLTRRLGDTFWNEDRTARVRVTSVLIPAGATGGAALIEEALR